MSAESNRTFSRPECITADRTLKNVRPGKTSREWVLTALGPPSSKETLPGGTELLKYSYVESVSNRFWLFPLVDAKETMRTGHDLFFEIRHGVVQKYWRDSALLEKQSRL